MEKIDANDLTYEEIASCIQDALKEKNRTSTAHRNRLKNTKRFPGVRTGIQELDKYLGSGLNESEIVTIAGQAGTGKTTIALNVMLYVATHYRDVIYVSTELPAWSLTARIISMHCATHNIETTWKQRMLQELPREEEEEISNIIDLCECNMKYSYEIVDWKKCKNNEDLEALLTERKKDKELPPLVIIDYLQNYAVPMSLETAFDQRAVVDISIRQLSKITTEYQVPIILLSEINRSSYDLAEHGKKKDMSRMLQSGKESGKIEYASSIYLFLTDEGEDKEQKDNVFIGLTMCKNRYGKCPKEKIIMRMNHKTGLKGDDFAAHKKEEEDIEQDILEVTIMKIIASTGPIKDTLLAQRLHKKCKTIIPVLEKMKNNNKINYIQGFVALACM